MSQAQKRKRRATVKKQRQRSNTKLSIVNDVEEVFSGPNEYTVRQRARKLSEIITAYPQHIALGLASRDEAGWIFGRLYLVGVINVEQRIAAEALLRISTLYKKMLNRYYGSHTSNSFGEIVRVDGKSEEDLSELAEKRFEKVRREYNRVITLLRESGDHVSRAVLIALETDSPTDLLLIRKGLDALRRR